MGEGFLQNRRQPTDTHNRVSKMVPFLFALVRAACKANYVGTVILPAATTPRHRSLGEAWCQ